CQTVDNVLVDTGSHGLRLMASALDGGAPLTAIASAGQTLVECAQFADGFTWGPVRRADVRLAGELAANVPVQVIGDSNFPGVPTACQSTGDNTSPVQTFGANGVLGIGVFETDCGNRCAGNAN